ncbi:MAG: hypothetical protein WB974_12435, partial [Acidobacteriaceae bacterium]
SVPERVSEAACGSPRALKKGIVVRDPSGLSIINDAASVPAQRPCRIPIPDFDSLSMIPNS